MKVITHGNCLRFICPECQCVFQATCNEKGIEWKEYGYDMPNSSGYYAKCPECGEENVKGDKAWEKEC